MFTGSDGGKYDGEWKDDLQHGVGKYISPSGKVYEGDFVEGQRTGKGVCVYPDGSKYDGEWEADNWNGTGELTQEDGTKYIGEFVENEIEGQGE